MSRRSQTPRISTNRKKHLRRALIEMYGAICCWCGKGLPPDDITLDHVLPKWAGGGSDAGNLVLAHARCNQGREAHCRVHAAAMLAQKRIGHYALDLRLAELTEAQR